MVRRMLIDATHPEETRVTVVSGNRLEEFDYEAANKQQLKGNIYLAKVTRVEPSLQAAFVDYGGNRHGFLAFSEIHPDYYRIPVGDREDLEEDDADQDMDDDDSISEESSVEEVAGDEVEESAKSRPRLKRHYKIQEVIKRNQILLVQVVKEERGNKGAALTTYLSLAGRYCVLMPNTSRGGGVSRKITNIQDRKRLKTILSELSVPEGMAVIVRTAGAERSKLEIKRDFEYISKLWDDIRQLTLESTAPSLINEEASLIKRSIRDLYSKDMEEVLVAGEEAYRTAKDFMKALIPSHAKKVQPYKDEAGIPLFQRYQVESQLNAIYDPVVHLRSGGSIVIHQTEALVAIDVNSGKATKERHIEETAIKTNLEAAEEVARQLRLRDLAGLVVIDFIDMEDSRNEGIVERKLKEALRRDRARIQVGRISPFGLLEMSRQRLRPSLLESLTQPCPTCGGTGFIQSTDSAALSVLRAMEEEGLRKRAVAIRVTVPTEVAIYILNHKRAMLETIEDNCEMEIFMETSNDLLPPAFNITRLGQADGEEEVVQSEGKSEDPRNADDKNRNRRRKRNRKGRRRDEEDVTETPEELEEDISSEEEEDQSEEQRSEDGEEDAPKKRRKRGRRGGRRRNRNRQDQDDDASNENGSESDDDDVDQDTQETVDDRDQDDSREDDTRNEDDDRQRKGRRNRGRGRGRGRDNYRRRDRESEEQNTDTSNVPANDQSNSESVTSDPVPAVAQAPQAVPVSPAPQAEAASSNNRRVGRWRRPAEVHGNDSSHVDAVQPVASQPVEQPVAASTETSAVETQSVSETPVTSPAVSSEEEKAPAKGRSKKASAKKGRAKRAPSKKAAASKPEAATAGTAQVETAQVAVEAPVADPVVASVDTSPAIEAPADTVSEEMAPPKKTRAKKATAKKATTKKAAAKKTTAKKATAKKATTKKAAAKKASAKKASAKKADDKAPEAAPVVTAATEAPASQTDDADDGKPRRRGWWSRG